MLQNCILDMHTCDIDSLNNKIELHFTSDESIDVHVAEQSSWIAHGSLLQEQIMIILLVTKSNCFCIIK